MLAVLCSGQGEQHREMFALTGQSEAAEPVFRLAAAYFGGVDPRQFVRDAREEALFENRAAQLLCCTQALAAWAALESALSRRLIVVGYSAGELASWGCVGMLTAERTLMLAARRAEIMDEASAAGYGMLGVVGIDAAALLPIAERHGFHVSIVNDIDSFVVAGPLSRLDSFAEDVAQAGVRRLKRLNVRVPSHTPLLARAAERFADVLSGETLRAPASNVRLLSGIDADRVVDTKAGMRKLAAQIGCTIQWRHCLETAFECGAQAVLELGPGDALCRMVQPRQATIAVRALDHFRTLDGVQGWIVGQR